MVLSSVVITTCNRETYMVKQAIESVLNQSYDNVELIVVNDAPEFIHRKELEQMISEYDSIVYIVNDKQKGANYSRNLGAKLSNGDVISFLDDDDYWDTTRIEKVMKCIEKGADIVYSDFYIFSENNIKYSKRIVPNNDEKVKEMLANNYLGGFSNVSIRKELFNKVGMLDEAMKSYQDQDLFVRLIKDGEVFYIQEPLSYYRITENSISLNSEKKMEGLLRFIEKYNFLFELYPESKVKRLESELIYAAKQRWKNNVKCISKLLEKQDYNRMKVYKLKLTGYIKYIAVKYFKMQ